MWKEIVLVSGGFRGLVTYCHIENQVTDPHLCLQSMGTVELPGSGELYEPLQSYSLHNTATYCIYKVPMDYILGNAGLNYKYFLSNYTQQTGVTNMLSHIHMSKEI